jgi:phytoene dehydrogenase-like protein
MGKDDVVIVGGGLAGLECGAILSKEGFKVTVLEQSRKTGGFFQSFTRNGHSIDSSVHYVGSLDKGELLYDIFKYLGILENIRLSRMNPLGFDNIHINDEVFPIAMGHEQFCESLSARFPNEKNDIKAYTDILKDIGTCTKNTVQSSAGISGEGMSYLSIGAYDEIERLLKNNKLCKVVSGNSIIYGGERQMTPFYVHAITNNSYLEGSYRFSGGAEQVTKALKDIIEGNGGNVRCGARVTKIITVDNKAGGAELEGGEIIESNYVVSSLHPALTLNLIDDNNAIRSVFRNRITSLKNSYGLFCLYLIMKEGAFPYLNENHFIFNEGKKSKSNTLPLGNGIIITMQVPSGVGKFAEVVSLMRPMYFSEVEKWSDTRVGNRGEDYLEFKERVSEEMTDIAESRFPGFKSSIASKYSATPLTFRDYLSAPEGSAYGIMKNYNSPLSTLIQPKSKINNLFLTGQSLNLHGVMGVTITVLMTCYEILGTDYLSAKIFDKR